jgi:cytochrome oxidase assembly protein ShyY1
VPHVYAFARQPKWIAGHLLAAVLLITFVLASLWQFDRYRVRSDQQDVVHARTLLQTLTFEELFDPDSSAIEFRIAQIEGRWHTNDAVLIRNRSFGGTGGCHLVVPFGTTAAAVAVNLGWMSEVLCNPEASASVFAELLETPSMLGRVRTTQTRGSIGPRDAPEGKLETMARVDVARIDQQTETTLAPIYLEATQLNPPIDADVRTLIAPAADNGPHLGYAGQWFMFFLVGAIGYPLVLRRQAHKGEAERLS